MSWYWEMHQRVEDGEDVVNLTIEKFEKWLDREIIIGGMSYGECPLCVKVSDDCTKCVLIKYSAKCTEGDSLYKGLMSFLNEGEGDNAKEFVKGTILPLLRKIKEETD